MKLNFSFFFIVFSISALFSQNQSFTVSVDKDTIFQDEVINIQFLLENMPGKFVAPDFESFDIVSGPNTSSNVTIINGELSQKKSYSYILLPATPGSLVIGQARVDTEKGELLSDPINIFVLKGSDMPPRSQGQKRMFRYDAEAKAAPDSTLFPKKRIMKKI